MSTEPTRKPAALNPLEGFWRGLAYSFDRAFKTGRRRSEFEHKYRSTGDYFGYHQSPYEKEKYARTLQALIDWRGERKSVLEIGCSVGVFTEQLAKTFPKVTAADIAQEALVQAAKQVNGAGDVDYVRADVLSLDIGRRYDIVLCAEVLMYVPERDGQSLCDVLEKHLAEGGLIVEVTPQDRLDGAPKFFHGWDKVLGARFRQVERRTFDDPKRPYEVVAYARR